MAQRTIRAHAVVHDVVEAEHPLLDLESPRPCLAHTERKLLAEASKERRCDDPRRAGPHRR